MSRQQLITPVLVFALLAANAWAGNWRNAQIAEMSVRIYVPDTPPKLAGKHALMVCLHGCIQQNQALQQRGNWTATADEYGMVVALPNVPSGGVIIGCWDYYGEGTGFPSLPPRPKHTRESRHNGPILSLVRELLADENLNIDANQVYLSGLSSGGGQTMVLGCLAPDVFAGLGINAGPTVGTGPNDTQSVVTDLARAKARCLELAGNHRGDFSTQITSAIYGTRDTTCAPGYNRLNAEVMAELYGASETSPFLVSELPGYQPRGEGRLWSDAAGPRVSLISVEGMGHAWPAGSGPGKEAGWIANEGVNYPAYVTKFFFENNRRLNDPPTVTASVEVDEGLATVSGTVSDVGPVNLSITLKGVVIPFTESRENVELSEDGQFIQEFGPLPDANVYRTTLEARDEHGALATLKLPEFDVGKPEHPPVIEEIIAVVNRDCVHLRGLVFDPDGDLVKVLVQLDDNAPQEAVVQDSAWTVEDTCGLTAGTHTALVTAVDAVGLESEPEVKHFDISPPYQEVTTTLTGHTIAQHFRYYPGQGFGAADATYLDLLTEHGLYQEFPLYGFEDRWYADPTQLQEDIWSDLRLRNHLIGLLQPRLAEAATAPCTLPCGSTAPESLTRQPLNELLKRVDQQGISLFEANTPSEQEH